MKASEFATEIVKLFPPFRWDATTTKAWSDAVVRECGVFNPSVRKRAFDELVRKHDGATPHVAKVLDFCVEAKRWAEAEERGGKLPLVLDSKPSGYLWTDERRRLADELLRTSPLAKRALQDGWHLAFRDFVREHGHAPKEDAEIRACIRSARDFDEGVQILRDRMSKEPEEDLTHRDPEDTWVPLGKGLNQALMKLALSMLARRDEVARIIEGKK